MVSTDIKAFSPAGFKPPPFPSSPTSLLPVPLPPPLVDSGPSTKGASLEEILFMMVELGRMANGVVSGGSRSMPFRTPEVMAGIDPVTTGVREGMLPLTLVVAPGTRVLRDMSSVLSAVDVGEGSDLFWLDVAGGGFSLSTVNVEILKSPIQDIHTELGSEALVAGLGSSALGGGILLTGLPVCCGGWEEEG